MIEGILVVSKSFLSFYCYLSTKKKIENQEQNSVAKTEKFPVFPKHLTYLFFLNPVLPMLLNKNYPKIISEKTEKISFSLRTTFC